MTDTSISPLQVYKKFYKISLHINDYQMFTHNPTH